MVAKHRCVKMMSTEKTFYIHLKVLHSLNKMCCSDIHFIYFLSKPRCSLHSFNNIHAHDVSLKTLTCLDELLGLDMSWLTSP